MSGHSKWASIKHKKAITDSRRGQAFTKLANLVSVAAKQGGPDPEMNFRLRLAVDKAKAANMPMANIERAIKKGSGQLGGDQMEEITYEGYGPGGVAVLVEVATDNRNRTAADVRSAFTKHGGSLGTTGSVAYQFDQKGVLSMKVSDIDQATLDAIEAGAEDIEEDEGVITVYTAPTQLEAVRSALVACGYDIETAELARVPKNTVAVSDPKTAATLMKLMDALDELDDVTATHANFDMAEEAMEAA
ncbi:YebC/PmpR family DNA-binding transcriptional regulator [Candidatus Parcubacteria bacterium]|nr:YebC/PmpR family DNA-binding transcriptional regulator [Candidatus Parcubacteria bacterium]